MRRHKRKKRRYERYIVRNKDELSKVGKEMERQRERKRDRIREEERERDEIV